MFQGSVGVFLDRYKRIYIYIRIYIHMKYKWIIVGLWHAVSFTYVCSYQQKREWCKPSNSLKTHSWRNLAKFAPDHRSCWSLYCIIKYKKFIKKFCTFIVQWLSFREKNPNSQPSIWDFPWTNFTFKTKQPPKKFYRVLPAPNEPTVGMFVLNPRGGGFPLRKTIGPS